jgi:hypothetical protein
VRDYPRPITLAQEPFAGVNENAEPGVHYVAFDDPQVKAQYVIPAGASSASIPVILLRDPSLQEAARTLRITLVENAHFLLSANRDKLHRSIALVDKLAKPKQWVSYFFGKYGEAKHRFMIDTTGQAVDDKWFKKYFQEEYDGDYMAYLQGWLQRKLNERNASEGSPLTEKNGTIVDFYDYN